jgi:large subunit ribosomal protein L3
MAGHMGAVRVTTQNIEVVRVDVERGIVLVKGAVPGSAGGWVELRDAIKGHGDAELPVPGKFRTLDELNAPVATDADTAAPAAADGEEGTEA